MKTPNYILVFALVASACSDDATSTPWQFQEEPPLEEEPIVEPETPDYNAQWAGIWRVDQPTHALYEATWYEFRSDGTLLELQTEYLGGDGLMEIGFVSRCNRYTDASNSSPTCLEWSPTCTFGDSWRAADEHTLLISGECSDSQDRTIELTFDSNTKQPTEIMVENEEWAHNGFQWQWTQCDDLENCRLF
ncbi:hypothetical protein FRD01_05645 [Microvenator marinus]|uniref:Uncharacterized protein n=1 Tax=Microvenator marinus TaxID=2600177 RepID=A0A5B8XMF0_9DELT|nr:hypothetical protein [Microvenator marinus]QED26735.1 hypothetical protein FRD01_05645 [Microvenator marinus]